MRYLLLATAATALFFGAYWLLMRNEKRHTMVRFNLVGTLVLSLLLPAVHLRLAVPAYYVARGEAAGIFSPINLNNRSNLSIPNNQITQTNQTTPATMPLWQWFWLAGVAVAAVLLAIRLFVLWRRMRWLPFEERDGHKRDTYTYRRKK